MTGPAGRPARGRRDNGLDARDFVPLVDVDPRVGEHLLDVLGLAGIAAYLQPSADLNPIVRSTTLPSRPTDRLWADRRYANEARDLLAQHEHEVQIGVEADADDEPRDPELDVDAAWEEIIAGYDSDTAARSWPAVEDTDDGRGGEESYSGGGSAENAPAATARRDDLRPAGPPAPGPRDHQLAEPSDDDVLDSTDEEGYVPPPPPPMPMPSGHAILGVLSVLAGFLLFFRPDLLGIGEDLTMVIGVVGILGGAGMLVYQLRDGLSADDDPDDGAVV
jgi:hypothetical protein